MARLNVRTRSLLEQLGEPRDEYERERIAMCENDPMNEKLVQLTVKHLMALRQKGQH